MRIQVLIDIEGVTITPEMLGAKLKHAEWLKERLIEVTRENHGLLSELNCTKRRLAKAEAAQECWEAAQDVLPDEPFDDEWEEENDDAVQRDPDCAVVVLAPFNDEWDAWSDAAIDALRETK
jgi:hypothetical protein